MHRGAMMQLQREIAGAIPTRTIRWEQAEKLHITVRFIGDYPSAKLPDLIEALRAPLATHTPFWINFTKPVVNSERMIWLEAGIGNDSLNSLYRRVEPVMTEFQIKPSHSFHAHITLARFREGAPLPLISTEVDPRRYPELPPLCVDQLTLMHSELLPNGSCYRPIVRIGLSGSEFSAEGVI